MQRLAGVALLAVATLAAFLSVQLWPSPFGAALPAILIGWLLGARGLPEVTATGVSWGTKQALLLGVVMLGFTIPLDVLVEAGPRSAGLAVGSVVVAIGAAGLLGRLLGARMPLAWLLGIGTGVCGVSAMVAARSAVKASDDDLVTGTVLITVFGSIGMIALPALSIGRGIEAIPAGQWMGATLHAVPQALGAGLAAGGLVGAEAAALVKLARVALLPAIVLVAALLAHRGARGSMPVEVLGFMATLIIGNAIAWPAASIDAVGSVAKVFLIAGLAGMAAQTSLAGLRSAGRKPWIIAGAAWGAIVIVSLVLLHW